MNKEISTDLFLTGQIKDDSFNHPKTINKASRNILPKPITSLNVHRFVYPIADSIYRNNSTKNAYYKIKLNDRFKDITKALNFNCNKGMKHSYSINPLPMIDNETYYDTSSNGTYNNTIDTKTNWDLNNENKLSQAHITKEMRQKALSMRRLPLVKQKSVDHLNENNKDDWTYDYLIQADREQSKLKKRQRFIVSRIQLIERNNSKWKMKEVANLKGFDINKTPKVNPMAGFLKKKDPSNIKMTVTHIRDLKVLAALKKIRDDPFDKGFGAQLKKTVMGELEERFFK